MGTRRGPALRQIVFAAGLVAAFAGLYASILTGLIRQWSSDATYGYGYFVPIVAAWLVWERRHRLLAAPIASSWWGYAIMLAGLGSLLIGSIGGVDVLARLSMLPVLFGLVLFLSGGHVAGILAFPLAFLILMVPPPAGLLARLTWPLQIFTAWFSTEVLRLAGYPVFLNGIYIDLPGTRLLVAEACSGFRGLLSLGVTAVLIAYLSHDRWTERMILLTAVVPVAVLANAVRVATIILLGIYADPWHSLSGWLVFVVETGLLISLARALQRGRPLISPIARQVSG